MLQSTLYLVLVSKDTRSYTHAHTHTHTHTPHAHTHTESLSGGSLIIIYQLENKQTAHIRLLQFMADCGLLQKVRGGGGGGGERGVYTPHSHCQLLMRPGIG